ncbi:glyoxalase [Mycolicibacterium celeriflavum]|nr:glyoxalase [Mycolicibacterium celeriflavum]ORA47586.1 glyoxalase/bleomycin resistance/dioxygenase family protein [Mycolicibacterium celeriflavum]
MTRRGASVPSKFNDIAAVVATSDYPAARSWYSRIMGRGPDLEPIEGVAEWQITATAWLQLITDAERAGRSAVRIGVDDLTGVVAELAGAGIAAGEPVDIAGMVRVVDITDPDGNEVSFVADLPPE